ncbi:feruloyl esterase A2 [Lasiosphaeria miniovina]|uniref:feruloyl esterase n=1 Tax=Lasiosphaeria miniovina TaxID=1954250 RepID=A0AA40DR63_9PEZI|nr:feruloyl esterase A2 [Lasiosphaeria miniovina]KAK0712505.1 feruloyl esterase A2 [Lasiosphaeria miniovina]
MAASKSHPRVSLTLLITTLVSLGLAAKPSSGCGSAPKLITSASTQTPLTLTVNNQKREFFVKLPDNYNNTHPHRLVLTLHALGGQASQVVAGTGGYLPYYGLAALATSTNATLATNTRTIFVAPNGLSNGWGNTNGTDVKFIAQVLAAVEADACVDQSLRFSTGFSFGSAMSYILACSIGGGIDGLRAVAALSGNPQISGTCPGSTASADDAVAYYGQHGTSDTVLPIAGSRSMRDRFLQLNGCDAAQKEATDPATGSGTHVKTVYRGCKPDKPVVWVTFDGPHTPTPKDKGQSDTWVPAETWAFFSQFT